MQNFQDIFETGKRLFISDFLICMTVPLRFGNLYFFKQKVDSCEIKSLFLF